MALMAVLRDNAPNIIQTLVGFIGGFLVAVVVFRSKIALFELGQKNIAADIKELKDEKEFIKQEVSKELKMLDSRIDHSDNGITKITTSVKACQAGSREWRVTQSETQKRIFEALSVIHNDIKGLIKRK